MAALVAQARASGMDQLSYRGNPFNTGAGKQATDIVGTSKELTQKPTQERRDTSPRRADIPVRSNFGMLVYHNFADSAHAQDCCGQECPRAVPVGKICAERTAFRLYNSSAPRLPAEVPKVWIFVTAEGARGTVRLQPRRRPGQYAVSRPKSNEWSPAREQLSVGGEPVLPPRTRLVLHTLYTRLRTLPYS